MALSDAAYWRAAFPRSKEPFNWPRYHDKLREYGITPRCGDHCGCGKPEHEKVKVEA